MSPKLDRLDIPLVNQIFFEPTKEFIDWFIGYLRGHGSVIIEVGAGTGYLSSKLSAYGIRPIALDICLRDKYYYEVLQLDAQTFDYPDDAVVIVARPNRGAWISKTVNKVLKGDGEVIYISKKENVDKDLKFSSKISATILYEDAGRDDEVVYRIFKKGRKVMKKKKFYLVTFGHFVNSSSPSHSKPYWVERIENDVMLGKPVWRNSGGGKCPCKKSDVVYEVVEAESIEDLDWKKTGYYCPELDCGWLSPQGSWYGCDSRDHDIVAYLILNKEVGDLEKRGWCRVYGFGDELQFTCRKRLTAEQRNWLSMKGFTVEDGD